MRSRFLIVPALLLTAAVLSLFDGEGPASGGEAAAPAELPKYNVTGAEWTRLGRSGAPEFRARAATIDYFGDGSAKLHDISLDALGGTASPWTLTAPEGRSPPHEKRLELTGGVTAHGKAEDGAPLTFDTRRLWVDLLRRELYTEATVELGTDLRRASARGLRADFDGERVQLLNDVQVDYAPQG